MKCLVENNRTKVSSIIPTAEKRIMEILSKISDYETS